jgi:hypothetical protein
MEREAGVEQPRLRRANGDLERGSDLLERAALQMMENEDCSLLDR